jgi:hypothetical protein
LRHGGGVEHHHHVNDFAQLALQPVDEHRAADGVAAQREEIVLHSDTRDPEDLPPQAGEEALQIRSRRHVPLRIAPRAVRRR